MIAENDRVMALITTSGIYDREIGSDPSDEEVAMLGWLGDMTQTTLDNTNFRTVVYTGQHTQLTLMRLVPGEEIGWESHSHIDQFLRLEQGKARVEFGRSQEAVEETHEVEDDWAFIVPAGVWHNVVNIGNEDVKLYSLYSPPEHPDGTVHRSKAEADAAKEHSPENSTVGGS